MFRYRLLKQVHASWLIALLCVGIVAGTICLLYIDRTFFVSISWLFLALLLATFSLTVRRVWIFPVVLLAGMTLGLWRGSIVQQELIPYHQLVGIIIQAQGTVADDVELDKRDNSVLRLSAIQIDGHDLAGTIWVTVGKSVAVKRGDRVAIHGKIQEGFGNFNAAIYNAKIERITRPVPGDVGVMVRDWFADAVRVAIPEPEASLGIGYLLGQRRGLPEDLEMALKIAGLTHIIVASGYNLTILVRLARRLFEKVSKYLAALSGFAMIVGFIAITGLSPSMSRAGLVTGLSLLAWYYGRKFHPLVLLPLAAAVTLLINPSYGWNDLGWQLSFAAFAGVMILAPLLQVYFFGPEKPGFVRQILGETISAQLATLPILVVAFGSFSNVALLANLLILPLVPLAMLLVALSGGVSLLVPTIAEIVGLPATWLLTYMTEAARFFASLSWAQTSVTISWQWAILFYVLLTGLCVYMQRKTRLVLRDTNIVE